MRAIWALCSCIILVEAEFNFEKSHCSEECEPGVRHTLCKFTRANERCAESRNLTLTSRAVLTSDLLMWHNLVRNNFAQGSAIFPRVSNMRKMYWDDELEETARRWALQCEPAHDRCRKLPELEVGQNIGLMVETDASADSHSSFVQWIKNSDFNELKDWERTHAWNKYSVNPIGNVIKASSYLLGCAEATYERNEGLHRLLVCNYGSPAESKEKPLYVEGQPCTNCPAGTKCISGADSDPFSLLCKDPRLEDNDDERRNSQVATEWVREERMKLSILNQDKKNSNGKTARIGKLPHTSLGDWIVNHFKKKRWFVDTSHKSPVILVFKPNIIVQHNLSRQTVGINNNERVEEGNSFQNAMRSLGASETGWSSSGIVFSNYCQLRCAEGRHVMCRPEAKPKNCSIVSITNKQDVKRCVISRINYLRNELAGGTTNYSLPTASNMRKLVWDKELATLADKWAKQCPFKTDGCRDVERFPVNQIVMSSATSESNKKSGCAETLDSYISLMSSVGGTSLGYIIMQSDAISALLQLIWAESGRVGCAEVTFTNSTEQHLNSGTSHHQVTYFSLICNFEGGSKVTTGRAYLEGEPCTKCPKGSYCHKEGRFPYLCSDFEIKTSQ